MSAPCTLLCKPLQEVKNCRQLLRLKCLDLSVHRGILSVSSQPAMRVTILNMLGEVAAATFYDLIVSGDTCMPHRQSVALFV